MAGHAKLSSTVLRDARAITKYPPPCIRRIFGATPHLVDQRALPWGPAHSRCAKGDEWIFSSLKKRDTAPTPR